MTNFLHSSPSRLTIDPLMYGFVDGEKKKGSDGNIAENNNNSNNSNNNHINNNNPNNTGERTNSNGGGGNSAISSVPPSAQKFYSTGFTGWTPLISKTVFNDQLISCNSPNGKWYQPGTGAGGTEVDYSQGLSLTPFLTHNLQSGGGPSGGYGQYTPFHDKSMHLTDFFMDSPIRHTPLRDLDTITPSKFKIQSTEKNSVRQLIFQDAKNNSTKRSITQVDTPPRQPYKLSNLSVMNKENDGPENKEGIAELQDDVGEKENMNIGKENKKEVGNDEDDEDEDEDDVIPSKYIMQTPSKSVLTDISKNFNMSKASQTPLNKFETPKGNVIPQSSPSTVIMSSTTREGQGRESISTASVVPPSPTPKKEMNSKAPCQQIIDGDGFKPAMGVFSERKSKPKTTTTFKGNIPSNPQVTKSKNKAQMQAGMSKFQIVFTDVHTLMNGKNKKKTNGSGGSGSNSNNGKSKRVVSEPISHSAGMPGLKVPEIKGPELGYTDHNITKDSIISVNNSSMNTSNLNMSTDHSSFDLGGTSSTPNSKFFLDRMFDKPSPQGKVQPPMYYAMQPVYGNMPPPNTRAPPPPQQQQMGVSGAQQPVMMMTMSTPQHQNVVNYTGYGSNNEQSPNSETNADGQYTAFSYHALQAAFPKENPQGIDLVPQSQAHFSRHQQSIANKKDDGLNISPL